MSEKYWKAVKKTKIKGVYETGGVGGSSQFFFEIGKEYKVDGSPVLCKNGFHFYRKKDFVFGLDIFGFGNTFFIEIEATGEVVSDTEKCVSNSIKVLRYIPVKEWKKGIIEKNNSGNRNSGDYNSGDRNSGDRNSGDRNSGNYNSGNYNSGNYNSGDRNSGNYNSGDRNSGNYNSGNYNSGDRNSGNYNSGDRNSGNYNSGNYNSGNYNSGNYNSGYRNSGYRNSGNYNSGDYNSGNYNSGNYNSGNRNSGYRNSGNYNSGDYNSGNYNSGSGYYNFFCTQTKYFLFDVEVSQGVIDKIDNLDTYQWFDLTDKTYYEAWANCPKEKLQLLKSIKEFQTDSAIEKFKEITGIDLREVE